MTDFSKIANLLLKYQPTGWTNIAMYAQVTESSYEIFYYSKINGSYVKNYDQEKLYGIDRKEIRKCFKDIFNEIIHDCNEKKWYVCTFLINNEGKFSVEYEYNDYSENSLSYKDSWKDKYLK